MAETSPLVGADWLRAHLNDPGLRVLDCRFKLMEPGAGEAAYRAGHLPGAVYAHLERDLSGPKQPGGAGGRHPLPDPQVLAAWLGAHGIGDRSTVVCYDDPTGGHGFYAARAWWLLRWLGHDQVVVLNGGLPAYLAGGGPLTTDAPTLQPATFTPRPNPEMLASADAVLGRAAGVTLIDARAPARYRGEVEPIDRAAGHIPGAINLDWSAGLGENGQFRPDQGARFPDGDLIVYCGSGVSAAANLLALAAAGRPPGPHTRLYAGSWSDWVSDDARPLATGDGPA